MFIELQLVEECLWTIGSSPMLIRMLQSVDVIEVVSECQPQLEEVVWTWTANPVFNPNLDLVLSDESTGAMLFIAFHLTLILKAYILKLMHCILHRTLQVNGKASKGKMCEARQLGD